VKTTTTSQWRKAVRGKPFLAGLLLSLFVFVLAMAHSETLHHLVHVDAGMPEHQCAAKLLTKGHVDAAPAAVSVSITPLASIGCALPQVSLLLAVEYSLLPSRDPPAALT
jgi:hypothetical protein